MQPEHKGEKNKKEEEEEEEEEDIVHVPELCYSSWTASLKIVAVVK